MKCLIGIAGRVALLFGLAGAATASAGSTATYWNDDAARVLSADAPHPTSFRALTLDLAGMTSHLRDARD